MSGDGGCSDGNSYSDGDIKRASLRSPQTLKRYRTEEEIKSLAEIGSKDHW